MTKTAQTAEATCARCGRKQTVEEIQWTCAGCGGANIESNRIFDKPVETAPRGERRTSKTPVMDQLITGPAEIPLMAVLRSLNSMSSDGVRALYERLMILRLVTEANCERSSERDHFDQVRRLLVSSGVQGLD